MAEFHYTKSGSVLSVEQRQHYEENGFILIPKLVSEEILEECRQRFVDICDRKVDRGLMTLMRDVSLKDKGAQGEFLINKLQDFVWDDVLFNYLSYKPLVDIVEDIVGSNITVVHAMLINKPPNSDRDASRHPLHQDTPYFPFRPANSTVAAWTAMEKVDETNGCLFVVPGSHKGPLYNHDYPQNVKNPAFLGVMGLDHLATVNLIMEKGDTVFFHPSILHGSGPNMSKGFRKSISGHYTDSNCYFIVTKANMQPKILEEVEKLATVRGVPLTTKEIWKYRSRLIRGDPGNFQKSPSHL